MQEIIKKKGMVFLAGFFVGEGSKKNIKKENKENIRKNRKTILKTVEKSE